MSRRRKETKGLAKTGKQTRANAKIVQLTRNASTGEFCYEGQENQLRKKTPKKKELDPFRRDAVDLIFSAIEDLGGREWIAGQFERNPELALMLLGKLIPRNVNLEATIHDQPSSLSELAAIGREMEESG